MSLFPFISVEDSEINASNELPLYVECAWDFVNNIPILENGEIKKVYGLEAMKVWIYKTLLSPRYELPIYSFNYGSEVKNLLGKAYTQNLIKAEAERYVKEALEVNPYVVEVKINNIDFVDDDLSIDVKVDTIYGEVNTFV